MKAQCEMVEFLIEYTTVINEKPVETKGKIYRPNCIECERYVKCGRKQRAKNLIRWWSLPEDGWSAHALNVWSKTVRQRDNHTCVQCGQPGIVAHHIKPKSKNPALAYDPDNGITLCVECHGKEHNVIFSKEGRFAKILEGGLRVE